ncbi:hypothetical protein VZT92_002204 [Zoarces viviparus]|uniref:Uncharacterized protein n=1 Tax=Zoarces viviparus TaxID=48416 RepID=A0AAW1FXK0_ZOAVI
MSAASSCPASGCCPSAAGRCGREAVQLAQLHPRATVRSLNGKALNVTGVILDCWFLEYLVNARRSRR